MFIEGGQRLRLRLAARTQNVTKRHSAEVEDHLLFAMSSTPEIPEPSFPPIPPAIQKLLAANVNLLVVETVFPTLLIPIAIGLFAFSTPELRRKPVFILNIVALILGLILGDVSVYTQVSRIRKSCLSSPF